MRKAMALPEQISVRYTEEDAGYVSMRPVVKQTFRLGELAGMVVSIAGKDAGRVQQILRSGTAVYNGYRYWWDAISADGAEIERLLRPFPDDEPGRLFEPEHATSVLLEMGGGTQRNIVEITRQEASKKRLFGKQSSWAVLLKFTDKVTARYEKYAHARRADLFRISLPFDKAQELLEAMIETAPRKLRYRWSTLRPPAAVTFVCPRENRTETK